MKISRALKIAPLLAWGCGWAAPALAQGALQAEGAGSEGREFAMMGPLMASPRENADLAQATDTSGPEPDAGEVVDLAPYEPLWELRVGGSARYAPDYPGASDQSWNGIGAPIFIYRGERIRFGEYGVARAIAAETKRVELDISLDAVYSANSEHGGAREGMPDLDYLLQIGPQAVVNLYDTNWTVKGREELKLLLPVRAVASADSSGLDHVGYIAEPQLVYRRRTGDAERQNWTVTLFATFADQGLGQYWYDVPEQFVTPDRAAYEAEGGYVGTSLRAAWSRELVEDFRIYLAYQASSHAGAANEDSPLLQEDLTHAFSISFVWKALKSKEGAHNRDM